MSVVNILDRVTDWTRETICSQIKLKVPPEDYTDEEDAGYDYKTANPAAFTLYMPTKEKLPPSVLSVHPSICVQLVDGQESMSGSGGVLNLQLSFSAWNPGIHGEEVLIPNKEDNTKPKRWTGEEADAYYRRSSGGWRDVWNAVDVALREIESVTNIDGILIDRSEPVRFGPFSEQKLLIDLYPFWYAWVTFSVTYPIHRAVEGFDKFL